MKIIRPRTPLNQKDCRCGCIFEYDPEDLIETESVNEHGGWYTTTEITVSVTCPECGYILFVRTLFSGSTKS
jgi:hypothetical protein